MIAISGGAVSHAVLQEVLGWDDEVLLKTVQRLSMTGLVAEDVSSVE